MKEIIQATPQQLNYLTGLGRALHGAQCTRQLIKETGRNEVGITNEEKTIFFASDIKMAKMMEGGARGLYNELAHPIVDGKRTTDEEMKTVALNAIEVVKKTIYTWNGS